jgi:hypothetical protein
MYATLHNLQPPFFIFYRKNAPTPFWQGIEAQISWMLAQSFNAVLIGLTFKYTSAKLTYYCNAFANATLFKAY